MVQSWCAVLASALVLTSGGYARGALSSHDLTVPLSGVTYHPILDVDIPNGGGGHFPGKGRIVGDGTFGEDGGCFEYLATIVRVVDGDTIDVDIDLGFEVTMKNQRIRLIRVDAPGVRTRDDRERTAGLEAKAFVESLLPVGSSHILCSREYHGERDKYGRILGDFKALGYDGISLTEALLEAGHAEVVRSE